MGATELYAHLATGRTTTCRCWAVTRRDGMTFGFTDHDADLAFEGITFRADTGLTAQALEQSTGLSVDNTEAIGALNSAAIREDDIRAGRFDGAEVRAWLVNWAEVSERLLQFRGSLGEITRKGPAFHAELRGLAEVLNAPQGRVYQKPCAAVLGDARCGVDLNSAGYSTETDVISVLGDRIATLPALPGFDARWFERGTLTVLTGAAAGLRGAIKNDRASEDSRRIELWESLRAQLAPGDRVRVNAGCDKRAESCRLKFNNFSNFQGFPHIPGESWLMSVPRRDGVNDGGSLSS